MCQRDDGRGQRRELLGVFDAAGDGRKERECCRDDAAARIHAGRPCNFRVNCVCVHVRATTPRRFVYDY